MERRTEAGCAALGAALAALLWPGQSFAFVQQGHVAIEAAAYLELGGRPGGIETMRDLVLDGVLDAPVCFPVGGEAVSEKCARAKTSDPVAWWPIPHTDRPDLVLARQFDHVGQCVHYMAESDDESGDADAGDHVSVGLVWTAYVRCNGELSAFLRKIVEDPVAASRSRMGVYELMHAVTDSYSRAHVDRDYAHWSGKPGAAPDPAVHFLRVWQPTVANPFAGETRVTRHEIFEERDDNYLERFLVAGGRRCVSYEDSPYSIPGECLTLEAQLAREALVDLMTTIHGMRANFRRVGSWERVDKAPWTRFQNAHLAHTTPERVPAWNVAPEREEIPFLQLGARFVVTPSRPAQRSEAFLRVIDSSGGTDPIVLSLAAGAGAWRRFDDHTTPVFLSERIDAMFNLGDRIGVGFSPFELDYTVTDPTLYVSTRLVQVDWFEPSTKYLRGIALHLYGPEFAWFDRHVLGTFGAGVSTTLGDLGERRPGSATATKREESGTSDWSPPAAWDGTLRDDSGPIAVQPYVGATSGAGGFVNDAGGRLRQGVEVVLHKRNEWGRLNPLAYGAGVEMSYLLTGDAPHTLLGGFASGRWYALGSIGPILSLGYDSQDLSGAGVAPWTFWARAGLVWTVGALDIVVEAPTFTHREWRFAPGEMFSARVAADVRGLLLAK